METFRDSTVGHLLRLATGGKVLKYPENRDKEYARKYIDEEKSGYLAHHGDTNPPEEDGESVHGLGGIRTREGRDVQPEDGRQREGSNSSGTLTGDGDGDNYNQASGVKVDSEKGQDKFLVSWDGPNDPDNPQNWSLPKKFFVSAMICLLTTSIYIGSSIYSPGEREVEQEFGVSQVVATLGLTLFVAGYGLGPMIWAPMSEIPQIGRNPIYLSTLLVFVLFNLGAGYASNLGMLLAFRFLTGFFGSPVLATGGASITDMYAPRKRAYAMAVWGISAICGPTLGPLVGGFAAQHEGWRWTIWELIWLSGFAWIVLMFLLPETSATNILYRRTRRLRKLTGNDKLTCEPELMAANMTGREIAMTALVRPLTLNFTEPMVFLLNLYIALIYGLLYVWFESFVIVFIDIYGFNLGEEGLAYLGILIGAIVTLPFFFWYLHAKLEPKFNDKGELKPEERLVAAMFGAFCIPICLFWFGWTSRASVHWIVPIVGSGFFATGSILLFNSVLNYLPDAYPEYAASVLAGNDLFRSSFGAGFPLFANAMYVKLGVNWASSLLGFLSIAFIPIPFVLYKYGETLRTKHSKHARKDF
ncbi:hypothetical protein MBLNU457_5297t1 [Dothideomycetes sp. NU457]